ncbi:MAG: leucine--tRNA ligase [Candidatus Aenigmarchaeota archaeon]|nr:leucine--tRNA ligase [Candidatus Aenigmarchaeota archaeon]
MDLKEIEVKWQKKWQEAGIFEPKPDGREKFMVCCPYPYVNGIGHMGHMLTSMRVEATARFRRMQGFNVLYAQGFHATGQPIVAAAKRVAEGEKKQIEILKSMGVSDVGPFSDPEHWIAFFPELWKDDFQKLGYSIDWRRSFITTSLNKPYDSFVRWQFLKLKEKGLVEKGTHPVIFCPKCGFPIGDHDRAEGEGVNPEEVVLLKFELDGAKLPAMTYRPETMYGVTNLWINPAGKYARAMVNGEQWIVSEEMVSDLEGQGFGVQVEKNLSGKELIGKFVVNPSNGARAIILPAEFVDTSVGSGIVMSVPAHAPFDYIAVRDLRQNKGVLKEYGIREDEVEFDFVSVIKLEGYGEFPAAEIVEREKIRSQKDTEKLDKATDEIYKKEFHSGVLKISGHEGKKVFEAKEEIISFFEGKGIALRYYIIPQKVVCRCLTTATIKLVKDQWFLRYKDKTWKKIAHECVDEMKAYPDDLKKNFHYTIDWLNDWACTRDRRTSLGTTLPFDETQVIESLSDSTIYMAYYTISHILQEGKLRADKPYTESFFDHVFYGRGDAEKIAAENKVDPKLVEGLRKEFSYWYKNGFQLRSSGKDLVQNHLTFCIFNHTAVFPKSNWPEGIAVNGYVMLNGEKMSKSKGNTVYMKDAVRDYPADVLRFLASYAGDTGMEDANIELREAKAIELKLWGWYNFAIENYGKGNSKRSAIDDWFEMEIDNCARLAEKHYSAGNTKSALQAGFFNLGNLFKWYRKRSVELNKEAVDRYIETQTKLLAPITPHICEEIWSLIGKPGFVTNASWPAAKISYSTELEKSEKILSGLLDDIRAVLELSRLEKPQKIKIVVPEGWKYGLSEMVSEKLKETRNLGDLIKASMEIEESKRNAKSVQKYLQRVFKSGMNDFLLGEKEYVRESGPFLEKEFGCPVEFTDEQIKDSWPGKFGIVVE